MLLADGRTDSARSETGVVVLHREPAIERGAGDGRGVVYTYVTGPMCIIELSLDYIVMIAFSLRGFDFWHSITSRAGEKRTPEPRLRSGCSVRKLRPT